jgi:hypothetical protein
MMGE